MNMKLWFIDDQNSVFCRDESLANHVENRPLTITHF